MRAALLLALFPALALAQFGASGRVNMSRIDTENLNATNGTITNATLTTLSYTSASGGTLTADGDGIVLPDSGAWLSNGSPYNSGLYFQSNSHMVIFGDRIDIEAHSPGGINVDANGYDLALKGNPVGVVDGYLHFYTEPIGVCDGSFPFTTGSWGFPSTAPPARTRLCFCTYDGTSYKWINLRNGAIGDSTTCPADDVTIGLWSAGDGSGPAVEDQNMGPAFPVGTQPPKFGTVSVMWHSAGTGGTNGVQVVIYEYPSGPALCSCFVAPCSAAAHGALPCSCDTRAVAGKTYVARIGSGTDCAANPSDVDIGVQLLR